MHFPLPAQRRRRRLRRNIPLRRSQHLVPHHKFLHRRRPQQRRIKVRMKVPLRMRNPIRRRLVKSHRVRKRRRKQIVVANRHALRMIRRQRVPLVISSNRSSSACAAAPESSSQTATPPSTAPARQNDRSPPRSARDRSARSSNTNTARHCFFVRKILALRRQLPRRIIRNVFVRPNLAMRMRIARAHHRAAILKNLHVLDPLHRAPARDTAQPTHRSPRAIFQAASAKSSDHAAAKNKSREKSLARCAPRSTPTHSTSNAECQAAAPENRC